MWRRKEQDAVETGITTQLPLQDRRRDWVVVHGKHLGVREPIVLTVADHSEEGCGEKEHHLGDAVKRVGGIDASEADERQRDAEAFEKKVRDEASEAKDRVNVLACNLQPEGRKS